MARISRKVAARKAGPAEKASAWPTAVYARLSVEDSGRKDSDSIEVQVGLVAGYIEQRPYLKLIDTYIDNGATGTNFDRPDFNRLMDDVRSGKIKCIAVKDLSRFGRNYIEACQLLDKILPFLGVRFISVNDGYDSETETGYSDSLLVMLKNLINDAYVKDISRKSVSARKTQRERGEYMGAFAPYGYKKSDSVKGRLVPDDETASIVRDIFLWRSQGMGKAAIAKRLDNLGILCPSMRLRGMDAIKGKDYYKASVWQPMTIDKIVQSQIYLGHTVQGKTKQAYCDRQPLQSVPEAEWCLVENTHEPLVSAELWRAANRVREERREEYFKKQMRGARPENVLKGLLVCAVCGSKLVRKRNVVGGREYYYYNCPLMQQHGEDARYPMIPARAIYEPVLSAASAQIELAADLSRVLQKRGNHSYSHRMDIEKKIAATRSALLVNTKKLDALYESYVFGLLDENGYTSAKVECEHRGAALKRQLEELSRQNAVPESAPASDDKMLAAAKAFLNPVELSRDMAATLIDRIEIRRPDCIEIVWKHRDEFALL